MFGTAQRDVRGVDLDIATQAERLVQLAGELDLDRHATARRQRPSQRHNRRRDLHDLHVAADRDVAWVQVVRSRAGIAQVHLDRRQLVARQVAQACDRLPRSVTFTCAGSSLDQQLARAGRRKQCHDVQVDRALGIDVAVHEREQQDRRREREQLEPEVVGDRREIPPASSAARGGAVDRLEPLGIDLVGLGARLAGAPRRRASAAAGEAPGGRAAAPGRAASACAAVWSATRAAPCAATTASRLRTILPLKHKLTLPRSSETTTTAASVSSLRPIAARWRVPSVLSSLVLAESGKNAPACWMRPSRMITAPSCSGFS